MDPTSDEMGSVEDLIDRYSIAPETRSRTTTKTKRDSDSTISATPSATTVPVGTPTVSPAPAPADAAPAGDLDFDSLFSGGFVLSKTPKTEPSKPESKSAKSTSSAKPAATSGEFKVAASVEKTPTVHKLSATTPRMDAKAILPSVVTRSSVMPSVLDASGSVASVPSWLLEIRQVWSTKEEAFGEKKGSKAAEADEIEGDAEPSLFLTTEIEKDMGESVDFKDEGLPDFMDLETPVSPSKSSGTLMPIPSIDRPPSVSPPPPVNSRDTSTEKKLSSSSSSSGGSGSLSSGVWKRLEQFVKGGSATSPLDPEEQQLVRKQLKKVKAAIATRSKHLISLHQQFVKLKERQEADLEQWSRWSADSLIVIAKNFYQNKLLLIETQIEIEVHSLRLLDKQMNACDKLLGGDLTQKVLVLDSKGELLMADPDNPKLPDKIEGRKASLPELELVLKRLLEDFTAVKKESYRIQSKEERARKLRMLLLKAAGDACEYIDCGIYYHTLDRFSQNEFNRIMTDERYNEGKTLKHWRQSTLPQIVESKDPKGPKKINQFCRNFTKYLLEIYELSPTENLLKDISLPEHLKSRPLDPITPDMPLELYIERLIYPRIPEVLRAFKVPIEDESDRQLQKKLVWLRTLSQTDFSIKASFQCRDLSSSSGSRLRSSSSGGPLRASQASPRQSPKGSPKFGKKETKPSTGETSAKREFPESIFSEEDYEKLPYGRSVQAFSKMQTEADMVPRDIMFHCYRVMKTIEIQAGEYCKGPSTLSMDDMFPMFLWVTAHAKNSCINEVLAHVNRCSRSDYLERGIFAYALNTITGAVYHLVNAQPKDFGLAETVEAPAGPETRESLGVTGERVSDDPENATVTQLRESTIKSII